MKKKVCMLGTFAVGKSSLVRRYVKGLYSDKYLTTMGAKVDKKTVHVDDKQVDLLLWDLNGEDRFQELSMEYVQGTAGYLLVVDRTRRSSLEAAHALQQKVEHAIGPLPFLLVLNKSDLSDTWETQERELQQLRDRGWQICETSAKMGTGVEEVFSQLAHMIHKHSGTPPLNPAHAR